jgi:hypothetical protein
MDKDFPKLVSVEGKKPTIKDNPPLFIIGS